MDDGPSKYKMVVFKYFKTTKTTLSGPWVFNATSTISDPMRKIMSRALGKLASELLSIYQDKENNFGSSA